MLEQLKKDVLKANLDLVKHHLVIFTWGNVSGIDKESGLVVIKPSGVDYDVMTAEDMVVVDLEGNIIEGTLRPSSDTPTHLELYKAFPSLGGIVHTHSTYATAFAQAETEIVPFGTTHADYFYGAVPCTRPLTEAEIKTDYEKNTGKVIIESFKTRKVLEVPGVLVSGHGPFSFGKSAFEAVYHAAVLEETAKMALLTKQINPQSQGVREYLLDKHYLRKHGAKAYYGQNK